MIEQPFTFRLCSNRPRIKSSIPQYRKLPREYRWDFIGRHNPHPKRVNHFYGLQNMPICHVVDPPMLQIKHLNSAVDMDTALMPTNTLNGLPIFRLRSIPIREKAIPQVGIVTIHEAWRRELRALTESIIVPISEEIGLKKENTQCFVECHPYPICRPITSVVHKDMLPKINQDYVYEREKLRTSIPKFPLVKNFVPDKFIWDDSQTGDYESQVFTLLSQLLQATNVEYVKGWLTSASDTEKATVMTLLQVAVECKLKPEMINAKEISIIKEENDLNIPGETEERSKDIDRLVIGSDFDQNTNSCVSRPRTVASKIRPLTADSVYSMSDSILQAKPQTAPVILRYKTASRSRQEDLIPKSNDEEHIILD